MTTPRLRWTPARADHYYARLENETYVISPDEDEGEGWVLAWADFEGTVVLGTFDLLSEAKAHAQDHARG